MFECQKSMFQTRTIMAKASAMSTADAIEENEMKEAIDVIQLAVVIFEKDMGGGASIMVKP